MFTILMAAKDAEEELSRSLAALAPAAAAGLVADVVVADHGSRDATLAVADAAGCTIIEGCADREAAIRRAAGAARKAWLLRLKPGDLPGEAALASARDYIAQAGSAAPQPAAFLVRPVGGVAARMLLGWGFAAGGWSRPGDRRVLAPRAQAHRLQNAGQRWGGARLGPRIERWAR